MRTIFSVFLCVALFFSVEISAQEKESGKIASAKVKNLKGGMINTASLSNDGKPMIINFWATWCKACVQELSTMHDDAKFEALQKETGVKLVAVSIDDARNSAKVAPFVRGKGWGYEVYIDENSNFKRAMGVNDLPHTFVVDGKGEVVWQHNSYAPGDEEKLYEVVRKVAKGEKVQ